MRGRALACVVLLMLGASTIEAEDLQVQVKVSRDDEKQSSNANVVVWLAPIADQSFPPPTAHVTLLQKNKQFVPRLLAIQLGTIVDFPNKDPFFHNVFSVYKGKRFDLGLYEAGQSRSVRFDRPGVSFIFCNIHPEMSAVVIALPSPYFAVTDDKGGAVLRNVPSGRYRIQFWYQRSTPEALDRLSRTVNVPEQTSISGITVPELVKGELQHKNKYGQDYEKSTTPY